MATRPIRPLSHHIPVSLSSFLLMFKHSHVDWQLGKTQACGPSSPQRLDSGQHRFSRRRQMESRVCGMLLYQEHG